MITRDLVAGATGLLAPFNAVGVLRAADVHAALRIGQLHEGTGGKLDERVLLALALTVRALEGGSVCIDPELVHGDVFETEPAPGAAPGEATEQSIATAELPWPEPAGWLAALRASDLVADGASAPGGRPLRLDGTRLYLDRYWRQEDRVRRELTDRWIAPAADLDPGELRAGLDTLFDGSGLPDGVPDQQRLAAAMSLLGRVTVIGGGPGTGKTTTVARILALLHRLAPRTPRIALAAPTGKAAARLEEAVRRAAGELPAPFDAVSGALTGLRATTLHTLLGARYRSTRMRHHEGNPLPHDVVVIDEMSMVSLTMMNRLLTAARRDARLILVGDPDQLASVEAGAVLADITAARPAASPQLRARVAEAADRPAAEIVPGQVTLEHTWRFDGGIDELARAVRAGDAEAALTRLRSGTDRLAFVETDRPAGELLGTALLTGVRERVIESGRALVAAARAGDAEAALAALDRHRVLCAHRGGPFGVARWSRIVEGWLAEQITDYGSEGEWYLGRPLMITRNDPEAGLYNGDTGVVVNTPAGPRGAFARGGRATLVSPLQLDATETVHAMTVHKAQGSQFTALTMIVPAPDSPLLTRELFYTGITRASDHVEVIGSAEAIRRAIERPANRASGLRERLG
ncbi:exodeoxyribonuclease V subunit alpha [Naumannella huperziae]